MTAFSGGTHSCCNLQAAVRDGGNGSGRTERSLQCESLGVRNDADDAGVCLLSAWFPDGKGVIRAFFPHCGTARARQGLVFGGRITSPFTPGRSSRNRAPGSPPVM